MERFRDHPHSIAIALRGDVQAFLRSGGKVNVIPRGVSGECDLTITEARKLIKARALSARSAA